MIPIQELRDNPDAIVKALASRGHDFDLAGFLKIDEKRKHLQTALQALQAERNQTSKKVGMLKGKGEDATVEIKQMESVNAQIKALNEQLTEQLNAQESMLHIVPNIPSEEAPQGRTEDENVEIDRWREPTAFAFKPKDHLEIGQMHDGIHFEKASEVSGARFCYLSGNIAKIHRALGQFMLDLHIDHHGYKEMNVPTLVLDKAMYGAGQFPKFLEEAFRLPNDDLSLIPTSEVPLVNWVSNSIVDPELLPIKFVAHSLCFRREAGSYGKDTRGLIRMHQFEKVELVQCVDPKVSADALLQMRQDAKAILQALELPYRVLDLCRGDLGFGAARTFDLEVWMPAQQCYREISSISLCTDFQARRLKARFKTDKKPELLHTLNGSGVAISRCLAAVLENYQQADGSICIPEKLQAWFPDKVIKPIQA